MAELHPWLALDADRARKVVTGFLREYVQRTGSKGLVLGLSGGLDSALVAALATEALGAERVDASYLPGTTSHADDRSSAEEVAEHLGLALNEVSVAGAVEAIEPLLGVEPDRAVVGNLQARLRMAVLYARAQATGRLVVGTGNKSELLVGYFTKHGDGGVDLLPIGDLYKSQVGVLAEAVGLPERVRTRAPTAGLWRGQTDEAELGLPYATLDIVLAGLERQADAERIAEAADLEKGEVERIAGLVRSTWHKRNAPPIAKVGWRTVGVDWRESTL